MIVNDAILFSNVKNLLVGQAYVAALNVEDEQALCLRN